MKLAPCPLALHDVQGDVLVEGMGAFFWIMRLARNLLTMGEFNGFESRDISVMMQCASHMPPPDAVPVSGPERRAS